jgi:hypothetical protein
MSELKRISGIDIDQDIEYQWREWRIHRIAWVVLALILLGGVLGVFGQGPLANAGAGDPGSALALEYQRLDRYKAPTQLTVSVGPNTAREGTVRLSLNHDFLDRTEIRSIVPEPESEETGPEEVTYVFRVAAPDQAARIRFDFEYDRAGPAQGEVRLEGGPSLAFSTFVFP